MFASRTTCAFLLALGALYSVCANADSPQGAGPTITIQRQGDRLTARITGAPLRLVLDELRRRAGIHGQLLDATDEDTVSESFRDTPLPEAIARLLNGRSFLIGYGTSQTLQTTTLGAPMQLLILPRAYAVPPVGIASRDQTPMTINDLTQAMVDPDENVRARAQERFEQALATETQSAAAASQPRR